MEKYGGGTYNKQHGDTTGTLVKIILIKVYPYDVSLITNNAHFYIDSKLENLFQFSLNKCFLTKSSNLNSVNKIIFLLNLGVNNSIYIGCIMNNTAIFYYI